MAENSNTFLIHVAEEIYGIEMFENGAGRLVVNYARLVDLMNFCSEYNREISAAI